ncbi:MAG: DNA-processing protein DprA [Syntrophomonadaceae bacterium]|jgi:DNA processing protein
MNDLEKGALCVLHSIKGIGNRSLWKIKSTFNLFSACLLADRAKLDNSFLSPEIVDEILVKRNQVDPLNYLRKLQTRDIRITTVEDEGYPASLLNITDPPFILYSKGTIDVTRQLCIAIVGSRAATVYGKNVARKIARELVGHGIVVVSGMARGIDTEAHLGAIEGQGKTVAVLGSGLDIVYPRENKVLMNSMENNGAVLTEYSLGTPPEAGNFPMRNRIIAGLCRGVVLVEAKIRSGALITVDYALEQGKDVFAVPGPINSRNSEGPHSLIKQGAKLITCSEDIMEEYSLIFEKPSQEVCNLPVLNDLEALIINCIGYSPCHFDQLLKDTQLDTGVLSTALLQLEFEGIVKSLPGNYYVKV